jgi:hypothetical protein
MKNLADTKTDSRTPFARFEDFTKRLMAVPKKEIDKKQAEYERKKKRKKKNKLTNLQE